MKICMDIPMAMQIHVDRDFDVHTHTRVLSKTILSKRS